METHPGRFWNHNNPCEGREKVLAYPIRRLEFQEDPTEQHTFIVSYKHHQELLYSTIMNLKEE